MNTSSKVQLEHQKADMGTTWTLNGSRDEVVSCMLACTCMSIRLRTCMLHACSVAWLLQVKSHREDIAANTDRNDLTRINLVPVTAKKTLRKIKLGYTVPPCPPNLNLMVGMQDNSWKKMLFF